MPDECNNVKGCQQNFKQTTKKVNPGKHNGKFKEHVYGELF